MSGARNSSQSRVELLTNELRYFAIIFFNGLIVALQEVGGCCQTGSPNQLPQFILRLVAEFFALVGDDLDRNSVEADPFIEKCLSHCGRLLVGEGNNLGVLCERVRDCENVLLTASRHDQRSKEIGVYPLLGFCGLEHRLED